MWSNETAMKIPLSWIVGEENCSEKESVGCMMWLREGATAAPSPLTSRTPTMINGIRFFIDCPRTFLVRVTVFKSIGKQGFAPIFKVSPKP
jgi:hypothetical protein